MKIDGFTTIGDLQGLSVDTLYWYNPTTGRIESPKQVGIEIEVRDGKFTPSIWLLTPDAQRIALADVFRSRHDLIAAWHERLGIMQESYTYRPESIDEKANER